jgi:hypothetical protein
MVGSMMSADPLTRTERVSWKQWAISFCYWNHDVLSNTDGVLEDILNTVDQQRYEPPHPSPLPDEGERE